MSVLIKIKSIIGLIKTLLFKNDRVYIKQPVTQFVLKSD